MTTVFIGEVSPVRIVMQLSDTLKRAARYPMISLLPFPFSGADFMLIQKYQLLIILI